MLRALGLLVVAVVSVSCGKPAYAGPNCEALAVGTAVATLPLGSTRPAPDVFFQWSDPLIAGTDELRCCALNVPDGKPAAERCAAVDCAVLQATLRLGELGGPFRAETCGPRAGLSSCTAVIADGKVVGVSAFCFD